MLPYEPASDPDLSATRVLVAAADHDPYSSPNSTRALVAMLTRAGAEVELSTVPAGHGLVAPDLQALSAWLARRPA